VYIQKMRDMGEIEDKDEEDGEAVEERGGSAGSAMDVEGAEAASQGIGEVAAMSGEAGMEESGNTPEMSCEDHTMHKNRTY
jgi:hypothetical protein